MVRGARRDRLLGHRPVRHQAAARVRRRAPRGGRAGHRHEHRARWRSQYQDCYLVDNDSRFVFSFVRSAIEAGAAAANYVELVSAERVGDRWVAGCATPTPARSSRPRPGSIVNAAGPFVDELNTAWGLQTEHRIVYSKGIHLVVPRLTTTRHDRVLAFFDDTQRLFYVIPMGHRSVIGTTDTRVDTPFTHVDRRGPRVPARPDQRPPRPARAAHRRRRHRRALRRAPARGPAPGAATSSDADWTSLSRKHEIERDTARARRHRLRRQAHRLPQRRRGGRRRTSRRSASRSRRTCATGTASPPRRPATSSTARPG